MKFIFPPSAILAVVIASALGIGCSRKSVSEESVSGAPEVHWEQAGINGTPERGDFNAVWGADHGDKLWAAADEGVFFSSDGGNHWRQQNNGLSSDTEIYALWGTDHGDKLWAAGDKGVFFSTDAGEHWRQQKNGLPEYPELRALWGTKNGDKLWAAGHAGVFFSSNGGESWKVQKKQHFPARLDRLYALWGIDPGDKIWAAGEAGISFSSDGGEHWREQNNGFAGADIDALWGSNHGDKLWAAGQAVSDGIILFSSDQGEHWNQLKNDVPGACGLRALWGIDPGDKIWAAGFYQNVRGVILVSGDSGMNWAVQKGSELGVVLRSLWGTVRDNKVRIWAAGSNGLAFGTTVDFYPVLSHIQLTGTELEVDINNQGGKKRSIKLLAKGVNGIYQSSFEVSSKALGARKIELRAGEKQHLSFPIDAAALGIHAGDTVALRLQLTYDDGAYIENVPSVPIIGIYDRWKWFREHQVVLISAGVIAAGLVLFAALLIWSPLSLRALQRKMQIYELVSDIPFPILSGPLKLALQLTVLPWFAQHNRVLDAWVQRALPKAMERLENSPSTKQSWNYVPLPLRLRQRTEIIDRPTARLLGRLFTEKRNVVQIVGIGGSGKTTLALQMARWATEGGIDGLAPQRMLPLFIDEDMDEKNEGAKDLFAIVRRKLHAWFENDKAEDDFVRALLKKQRLLILIDRFSERSNQTQEHVRTIHGKIDINALIVTSRAKMDFESVTASEINPVPLDRSTLLYFMHYLLDRLPRENKVFATPDDQLKLGARLVKFLAVGTKQPPRGGIGQHTSLAAEANPPITPLLVKLFVEKALQLVKEVPNQALDELALPNSIPEVYFDYLCGLNPHGGSVEDEIEDARMLELARALASLAIGDDFVPKEFTAMAAAEVLITRNVEPESILRRFVANGILLKKSVGGIDIYRFILDPVCETLGAFERGLACGTDSEKWENLIDAAAAQSESKGFISALQQVHSRYGEQFKWPKWIRRC